MPAAYYEPRDISGNTVLYRIFAGVLAAVPAFILFFIWSILYPSMIEPLLLSAHIDYITAIVFFFVAIIVNSLIPYLYLLLLIAFDPEKYEKQQHSHKRSIMVSAIFTSSLFSIMYLVILFIDVSYIFPGFIIQSLIIALMSQLLVDTLAGSEYDIMSIYSAIIGFIINILMLMMLYHMGFTIFFSLFFPMLWGVHAACSALLEEFAGYIFKTNGWNMFSSGNIYSDSSEK
ncbi:MAG: hypothetical protein U9Q15_04195 [Patescibacteria group bacterium]|nr:hypothetical protein [Patescibacteria group bacterium]